jgi:hypothetical protein
MHTTTLLTALTGATLALANPAAAPAEPQITPGPGALALPAPGLAPRQFSITGGGSSRSKAASCSAELYSLALDAPTPTGRIVTWLTSVASSYAITASEQIDDSLTTICAASASLTPPASLSSAYQSYTSKFNSWASEVADEAHSIASDCGGKVSAMVELMIVTDEESCTKAVLGIVDVLEGAEGTTTEATKTRTRTGSATRTRTSSGSEAGTGLSSVTSSGDATETTSSATDAAQSTGGSEGQSTGGAASSTRSSTGGAAAPRETGFAAAAAAVVVGVAGVVAAL